VLKQCRNPSAFRLVWFNLLSSPHSGVAISYRSPAATQTAYTKL